MISYAAWIVSVAGMLIGMMCLGRRIFNFFFSGSFPERLLILEGEDEIFYEARTGQDETVRPTGEGDRGHAQGQMTSIPRLPILPTRSKQSLVNCNSCFCCTARKVISALFLTEFEKSKAYAPPNTRAAASEPSVSSVNWDWDTE